MRCSNCSYEAPDSSLYCPSCGCRINASCELAVIDGNSVLTRVMIPKCDYVQRITMEVDGQETNSPLEIEEDQEGGLKTLCFEFYYPLEEGFHNVKIYDKLHAFNPIVNETPVRMVNLTKPTILPDKYIFINDGILRLTIGNLLPDLADIFNLHYSINRRQTRPAGLAKAGEIDIDISNWRDLGITFDNTDRFETNLELFYQLWDDSEVKPFYSNNVFFVNRFRLQELTYNAPGVAPRIIDISDVFGKEATISNPEPIELYTYPNPFLNRNWQKDKRYFKLIEGFNDLLDITSESGHEPEMFSVALQYDRELLDLSIVRIEKFTTGDVIMQIDAAKTPGRHKVDLVLSIGDVNYPEGVFKVHVPLYVNVVNEWTDVLGLGLDFGTSRTMASIFNDNENLHQVVGLNLQSYGDAYEQKMAISVIPNDKSDYHEPDLGLIYPYICSDIKPKPQDKENNYGLKLYVKRDISKIMRNNKEITDQLREIMESMFETLMGRVMEYILQTQRKIPRIGDICLGCPTVFDDSTIMQYRDFLKNVCLASLIQPSPDFNVTVWDEVWAAFYYINAEYDLEPGHYIIWDTGGGTTDVVLVHLEEKSTGSMPIIGFNSDFLGGKDVNEKLRAILTELRIKDIDSVSESDIESLKISMSKAPKGKFRELPHKDLSADLQVFMGEKINEIAVGVLESMRRLGGTPPKITILPIGGGAHMKFIGLKDDQISLGEIIRGEMQKLLPETEIQIHTMHNSHQDREINRKACTSLGLSALTGNASFKGKINRLPGLADRCRYTIVRRDIRGSSETVMNIGDRLDTKALKWLESTNMFLVFGGSNTDENVNIPIIYGNPAAWNGFIAHLFKSINDQGEALK